MVKVLPLKLQMLVDPTRYVTVVPAVEVAESVRGVSPHVIPAGLELKVMDCPVLENVIVVLTEAAL